MVVEDEKEKYSYTFRVCGDVDGLTNAGLVQLKEGGTKVRIGNYNQTRVIGGSMLHCLHWTKCFFHV